MDLRLLFPSLYLNAADLLSMPNGEITMTISKVTGEKLRRDGGGETKMRGIVWFEEMEERHARNPEKENKRFVLSANVNFKMISQGLGYGHMSEGWIGKRITLYATTGNYFGDPQKPCIRVRPTVPPPKQERELVAAQPAAQEPSLL